MKKKCELGFALKVLHLAFQKFLLKVQSKADLSISGTQHSKEPPKTFRTFEVFNGLKPLDLKSLNSHCEFHREPNEHDQHFS